MKTIEELLENISDDMEFFGENRNVYIFRKEDGEICDYDFMNDDIAAETMSLKELEQLLLGNGGEKDSSMEKILLVADDGCEDLFSGEYQKLASEGTIVIPFLCSCEQGTKEDPFQIFREKYALCTTVRFLRKNECEFFKMLLAFCDKNRDRKIVL